MSHLNFLKRLMRYQRMTLLLTGLLTLLLVLHLEAGPRQLAHRAQGCKSKVSGITAPLVKIFLLNAQTP